MAKSTQKTQRDYRHCWYAVEWLLHYGKRQADLINDLEWSRAKASDVWNGLSYRQELIDELAPYLNLRPYELLLPVDEAMAIRQMRASAVEIAKGEKQLDLPLNVTPLPAKRA